MAIKQWTDIGHGHPQDKLWIILNDDIEVVSAGKGRTHMSIWDVETNVEEHWRGRYEVKTGYCSIAPSEYKLHMRRPPEWLLSLLRTQFSVVRFYLFTDGVESFSPNPRRVRY